MNDGNSTPAGTEQIAANPRILQSLNDVTYNIGVDFEVLPEGSVKTIYGSVLYRAVIVTCVGTKVVTRFESGDFKTDYDAARAFIKAAVIAAEINPAFHLFCTTYDKTLDDFIEKNEKCVLLRALDYAVVQ